MKKTLLATALVAALGGMQSANATNWLTLQNNLPPNYPAYKFWGFVQPRYDYNEGGAVTGLTAPVFNYVAPDLNKKEQFQIFRARLGVRGNVPNSKINYFLLTEFGNNGLTRVDPLVFSDATVTFNYIPGARIRVGLGRLPLGEEAMIGIPAIDYNNFTNVTDNLLNERFVTPIPGTTGVSHKANFDGNVGGFRDIGIEAYDWFRHKRWEYSYAVMLGNGTGTNWVDGHGSYDVSGRLMASYLFGGRGPKREDMSFYVWHQDGKRNFGGTKYDRMREGVGFKYLRSGIRFAGEYIRGKGMIFNALNPPFNHVSGSPIVPSYLMALDSSNKADGYYLDTGWRFARKWEADLRYDYLDRLSNSAPDERKFTTWTVGMQYFYTPTMRVAVNYDIRKIKANPEAGANANTIVGAIGNRISVVGTWVF